MDEGDRGMEQSAGLQQKNQVAFPSAALREREMTCPKCQSQNARPFMSWTISGRKMTIPQLRMWACVNPTCLHTWPRDASASCHEPD
jgi:hypothetical protein